MQKYKSKKTNKYYHLHSIGVDVVVISDTNNNTFLVNKKRLSSDFDVIYLCPKCKNEDNLHFNYDYSNDYKINEILCNECGTFFKPEIL